LVDKKAVKMAACLVVMMVLVLVSYLVEQKVEGLGLKKVENLEIH
jgi:hypothetical protein